MEGNLVEKLCSDTSTVLMLIKLIGHPEFNQRLASDTQTVSFFIQ
jgi:hypothetical protein